MIKPETQIRYLVRHISPLAQCLKNYRPSARNIHIRRADWKMLLDNPDLARTSGFVFDDEHGITYQGFTLVPIDSHKNRNLEEEP